jgi:hypothetical protein
MPILMRLTARQELVANADKFRNERIVLCHVSRKYRSPDRILRLLLEALPPSLLSRVGVTLAGFGRQARDLQARAQGRGLR